MLILEPFRRFVCIFPHCLWWMYVLIYVHRINMLISLFGWPLSFSCNFGTQNQGYTGSSHLLSSLIGRQKETGSNFREYLIYCRYISIYKLFKRNQLLCPQLVFQKILWVQFLQFASRLENIQCMKITMSYTKQGTWSALSMIFMARSASSSSSSSTFLFSLLAAVAAAWAFTSINFLHSNTIQRKKPAQYLCLARSSMVLVPSGALSKASLSSLLNWNLNTRNSVWSNDTIGNTSVLPQSSISPQQHLLQGLQLLYSAPCARESTLSTFPQTTVTQWCNVTLL